MKFFFDDDSFDGQLQRSVGKSDTGMANVGECLAVAEQITAGDRDSWHDAWSRFATALAHQANAAEAAGHRVSARDAYLRASEYHRQSFFFHREDLSAPVLQDAYHASVAAYRAALPLLGHPVRILEGDVPGYLHLPDDSGGPFPTLLHIGGYDGTAEELHCAAPPALDRGYAIAAIDGPGQGGVLYDQRVVMRPDWEHVVPGMFDAVAAHAEVDATRVVLVGRSFGGLVGPRGAAGEHRLAAMIVDPGQFDLGATMLSRLGELGGRVHDPAADAEYESLLQVPALQAFFAPRMSTHGVTTVRAYCEDMTRYSNAETAASITCPSYVADNETDLVSPGQGKVLFGHLTCPKEFRLFTKAEGADGHCEGMAPVIFWTAAFNWLDTTLGRPGTGG
ncbi:MAG: alpha/beta hydrolase [Acidimicrobiia bacterium]|nr:alpha/beta hydrolase [Acidimicrobiia bacterium]